MLDVHPPHHAASTWRDFFIHIATIVVGLLLAIGLEQTVEWAHHKHEVHETREALRREHEANVEAFHQHLLFFRRENASLQINLQDLLLLRAHPGTRPEELPGLMVWSSQTRPAATAAWATAKSTGVDALMSRDEVERISEEYLLLDTVTVQHSRNWQTVNRCGQYRYIDADASHLTPAGIDEAILCTREAMDANVMEGNAMADLVGDFPSYAPGPSYAELAYSRHEAAPDPALKARTDALVNATVDKLAAMHDSR